MHKRISTSIKKSQAEPEECWPAGPSQSLLPTEEDEAGPQEMRKSGKGVGEGEREQMSYRKAAQAAKHRTSSQQEKDGTNNLIFKGTH